MEIGVVSTLYPTSRNPTAGIFVKEELDNLAARVGIRLVTPLPNQHWFLDGPGAPEHPGYPVIRPFTLAFPRFFMQRLYPWSMAVTLRYRGGGFFRGCDLIHAHNAFPEGVAAIRAFGGRLPVVVTVHGSDVNFFAMKPALRPGIVEALNEAAAVICVSAALERTLRELGVESATEVIPNGVDTGFFGPGGKSEASLSLGLDPSRPRVLFAGNFVPVKGIEYLIRAMPAVLAEYPDCELVLLGAGRSKADKERYREDIEGAGATESVRIVERVPHDRLPPWIHASDVLVLPSIREGFGLVAAEALACGRPVVATRSGGPEDIVEDGTGILVPPKNSHALARAVIDVLDGKGIREPEFLAESARRRFSYDVVTEKIVGVYERAAEG